jgi:hypothetical protein
MEQSVGNNMQSNNNVCHFTLEALAACVVRKSLKRCPFAFENCATLVRRIT